MDFYALAQQCQGHFNEKEVIASIARTESSFNPYAIGVVGGSIKQPRNLQEAILAVRALRARGANFSVGLMQVNQSNFAKYGLNESNMFDPCSNIRAGASIFRNCFDRASQVYGSKYSYDSKLKFASSCYYSGNFSTGFRVDFRGQPPYVAKFFNNLVRYRGGSQQRAVYQAPVYQAKTVTVVAPTQQLPMPAVAEVPQSATVATVQTTAKSTPYDSILKAIQEQNKTLATIEPVATKPEASTIEDDMSAKNVSQPQAWDVFNDLSVL